MASGSEMHATVRKAIQSIKEVVGSNYSDGEIYSALQESNMDPNDAVQKLVNQDPFHEVKRKGDKKKEVLTNIVHTAPQPYKQPYKHSEPLNEWPLLNAPQPYKHSEPLNEWPLLNANSDRSSRGRPIQNSVSLLDAKVIGEFHVVKDNTADQNPNSEIKPPVQGQMPSNELEGHFPDKRLSTTNSNKQKQLVGNHSSKSLNGITDSQPRQSRDVKLNDKKEPNRQVPVANDNLPMETKKANDPQLMETKKTTDPQPYSATSPYNSVAGLYMSSSDPVHVPSPDSRPAANIGAIKREVGARRLTTEISGKASSPQSSSSSNLHLGHDGRSSAAISKSSQPTQTSVPVTAVTTIPFIQSVGHQKASSQSNEWKQKSTKKQSSGPGVIRTPAKSASPANTSKNLEGESTQLQDNLSRVNISENKNVITAPHIRDSTTDRHLVTFGSIIFEPSINSGLEAMKETAESCLNPTASVSNVTPESFGDESSGSKQVELVDECVGIPGSSSPASAAISEQQLNGRKESSSPQDLDNYVDVGSVGGNSSTYIPSESQQHQDHPPPTLPVIPDVFFPSFDIDYLKQMGLDIIKCLSKEDALMKHQILSTMPKKNFLKSSCAALVDGVPCIVVEQHQLLSYKAEHRRSAVRHIIDTPIQLEREGILHTNLTQLVDVDSLPKFCSIPSPYDSYKAFRENIKRQSQQICQAVDQIVGAKGVNDKEYLIFRKRLLSCETIVDLDSMLFHPWVNPNRNRPFYFGSCRLALSFYAKFNRTEFHRIIDDFSNEDFSLNSKAKGRGASTREQKGWINALRTSKKKKLKDMLDTRIFNKVKVDYSNSNACHHLCIRNSYTHMNDDMEKYASVEDMHKDMEEVFPLYSLQEWEYLHGKGLHGQFGPQEYGYFFLNCVKEITRSIDDKRLYLAPLLKACRMCLSMTAKFHNSHERSFPHPPFKTELEAAGSEIVYCIKGLDTYKVEYHLRTNRDQMIGLDELVLRSVRIIIFALNFLFEMRDKKTETGHGISRALESTLCKFKLFNDPGKKFLRRFDVVQDWWPASDVVCKITGLHFIIAKEAIESFGKEINVECRKLYYMLTG